MPRPAFPPCFAAPCPPQAGKQKGSTAVGRHLADAVAAVPHFTKADFEKMLADQQNDCTLVRGRAQRRHPAAGSAVGCVSSQCQDNLCHAVAYGKGTRAPLVNARPLLHRPALQVLFLSKLIQAHLALADKLGTMQLPLL